ncbi:hypothetical protein ACVNF4_11460 [Streptomyces sp. S6]
MAETTVRIDGDAVRMPGGVTVRFMRTLRLPETGTHPLPPGLGDFPVRRITDYPQTAPAHWLARGGVMLPMYLREAMWLNFTGTREPGALQVGVGKVCAVSGERWSDRLSRDPQNYVVLPRQPWLDGINSGKGTVRQFVAVPLGLGATVEGQVTGEETWGGVQLQSFSLTEEKLRVWRAAQRRHEQRLGPYGALAEDSTAGPMLSMPAAAPRARAAAAMGLGVGGSMRQEVYQDDRPLTDWSPTPAARLFVHLVTPPEWHRITGENPPPSPVDRAAYTQAGLPWFDYYDDSAQDLPPTGTLGTVKPVGDWIGDDLDAWEEPGAGQVKPLKDGRGKAVEDGEW